MSDRPCEESSRMTFFTSCAAHSAEDVCRGFRGELISLGKDGMGRQ